MIVINAKKMNEKPKRPHRRNIVKSYDVVMDDAKSKLSCTVRSPNCNLSLSLLPLLLPHFERTRQMCGVHYG